MKDVITKLLREVNGGVPLSEVKIPIQVQIVIEGGISTAGALSLSEFEGMYELLAPMQRADKTIAMVRSYVRADAITMVSVPVEEEQPVVKPAGGLVIPGRRS